MAVSSVVTTAHGAFGVNTPEDAGLPALRIVALGGGTGLPTVLRGLRAGLFESHPWDPARDQTRLTAIATVAEAILMTRPPRPTGPRGAGWRPGTSRSWSRSATGIRSPAAWRPP